MKTKLKNKYGTKIIEIEKDGWSWGAFWLGVIWYCIKGLWGKGLGYFLLSIIFFWTFIVPIGVWVYMCLEFKKEYYNHLLDKGYKPMED